MSTSEMHPAQYVSVSGLSVSDDLFNFIHREALPGSGVTSSDFWDGFATLLAEFSPRNRALLRVRDDLQDSIDRWYETEGVEAQHAEAQLEFLASIGYIVPEPEPFKIETEDVAPEIALSCGPQLVVPADNARYAINAANARWGSLYDALYGTDAIDAPAAKGDAYDRDRGRHVIAYGRKFLDRIAPLVDHSHQEVSEYRVDEHGVLIAKLSGGKFTGLRNPQQLAGWAGPAESPYAIVLKNNGLHIEVVINPFHPVGETDRASVCDIVLESAVTTIIDFEDSVAAVDGADKCGVYRNWLGLSDGNLTASFKKNGQSTERRLSEDKVYCAPSGEPLILRGTAQLLVRNVGHLMTTSAVLDPNGDYAPEGLLDAFVTGAIARRQMNNRRSPHTYIVKPKIHGPDEVAFAVETLERIEQIFGLPNNCLKIGVMDEERRTSVNLRACIMAARSRVFFINTGFLDRTGDEIHTMMKAGPVQPKEFLEAASWRAAYEDRNVAAGLQAGFVGKAQIGKGMWAKPDQMAEMMTQKIAHPQAGASTAWVPSPTAATLHALHYHEVDVKAVQERLIAAEPNNIKRLLEVPILPGGKLPGDDLQSELDNNIQGILGYVVRWVQQGIGCSKVPNIDGVGMMEDRATLRISSQIIANWLRHSVCTRAQVEKTLLRMALVVDEQNSKDNAYIRMSPQPENSCAFQAARELLFEGHLQPNGYTEPILHKWRLQEKAMRDQNAT